MGPSSAAETTRSIVVVTFNVSKSLFAAARHDQTAVETEAGGRYSVALGEALLAAGRSAKDQPVSLSEVFRSTRESVQTASHSTQSPTLTGDPHIAELIAVPAGSPPSGDPAVRP